MDETPNTAIMPASESKPATVPMYQIHAEVRRRTDNAVLIRYAGRPQMWLPTTPKSGVTVGDARGGKLTPIWLPLWLARKKGIVSAPRPRRRP